MCVTARAVDATVASPGAAFGTGAPSVRSIALGGSEGDWCHVRSASVASPAKVRKYSYASLSLRNRRSRLARSRDRSVEERPIALRRRALAAQEDRCRLPGARPTAPFGSDAIDRLARDPCSARRSTGPRAARGFASGRRRRRGTCGASAGCRRTRGAGRRRARSPQSMPVEALLGARDLDGAARERRALHHHLVARGHLHVPVAAVERLGPHERRGLGRAPLEVARAGRHAVRSARDRRPAASRAASTLPGAVPHLDVVREAAVGRPTYEYGLRIERHQDVLAVGRERRRR